MTKTQNTSVTHAIKIASHTPVSTSGQSLSSQVAERQTMSAMPRVAHKPILLRHVIGEELRRRRQEQQRTLREVSRVAQVSLGYLSEVERGQKEASSELLASICAALDASLSDLLIDVSAQVAQREAKFDRILSM